MKNKFKIGDFVFWYAGDSGAGYGNIEEINLDKNGLQYKVYDETCMGDYPKQWHKQDSLYCTMKGFNLIADFLRMDTEKWIKDCKGILEKRILKETK